VTVDAFAPCESAAPPRSNLIVVRGCTGATIAHGGFAGAGGRAQQSAQHFAHAMVETAQESFLAVMKDGGHEIGQRRARGREGKPHCPAID